MAARTKRYTEAQVMEMVNQARDESFSIGREVARGIEEKYKAQLADDKVKQDLARSMQCMLESVAQLNEAVARAFISFVDRGKGLEKEKRS